MTHRLTLRTYRPPGDAPLARRSEERRAAFPLLAILLGLGMAGCGGGAGDTGAGAGDTNNGGAPTPNPLVPLVGTWNLGSDWDGNGAEDAGEALLVIRPLEEGGLSSAVRLYDFDTTDGCYFLQARVGEAELDPARREQVFMNNVFPFESAVLTLEGNSLVIDYLVDDDPDAPDALRAPNVAQTESDLESQVCRFTNT